MNHERNGHQHDPMALGVLLGGLQAESRRQTEIMLSGIRETQALRTEIHDLPDRIAAQLTLPSAQPAAVPWLTISRLAQVLGAMALLAAVVAGKMTHADALPLIRILFGVM